MRDQAVEGAPAGRSTWRPAIACCSAAAGTAVARRSRSRRWFATDEGSWAPEIYACEDKEGLQEVLGQQYHAVVGNPPYITVKDQALNAAYRERYLDLPSAILPGVFRSPSGSSTWPRLRERTVWVRRHDHGQLVHEAGVRQEADRGVLPQDRPYARRRHVRGLHPRPRDADGDSLRSESQPSRRQPCGPCSASRGSPAHRKTHRRVSCGSRSSARSIEPDAEDEFTSTADVPRTTFASHPWSIGGGGAADLKDLEHC